MAERVVILIDGMKIPVYPDSMRWERSVRYKDGDYAPVYNPFHRLRMSSGVLTSVMHEKIFALMDSLPHTLTVPHPSTGVMTDFAGVYIDLVTGGQSTKSGKLVMAGYDMELSGIEVTY